MYRCIISKVSQYSDILLLISIRSSSIYNANQKHLGCKKGEANQKQKLYGYEYIAILATKSFDIS